MAPKPNGKLKDTASSSASSDCSNVDELTQQIKGLDVQDDSPSVGTGKLSQESTSISSEVQQAAKIIQQSKRIIVVSGAGVSVSAGIPDFRSPGTGLYDNLQKYNLPFPEAVFDLQFYRKNPKPFVSLAKSIWPGITHAPTITHTFLAMLSEKQLLLRDYSQNIDGLEYLAGMDEEHLVECHGHFRTASCIKCRKPADGASAREVIVQEGKAPVCQHCKGYVKPDIVFFGEGLPDRFHNLLQRDVEKADCCIVMGTSLQVAPVSMIPDMLQDCPRILINRERVGSFGRYKTDLVLEGDCDDTINELATLLGWSKELHERHLQTKIAMKQKQDGAKCRETNQ